MKDKIQKAALCLAKTTVKTQTLIKEYTPAFEDAAKQEANKKALYYHRNQNGLIRISRWKFNSERKTQLDFNKNEIQIESSENFYEYNSDEDGIVSFYIEFSGAELFSDCQYDGLSQSDTIALEHPLLLSCVKYLYALNNSNFQPDLREFKKNVLIQKQKLKEFQEYNLCEPTPFVFQNIPRWIKVPAERLSENYENIVKEEKTNIISMKAISGEERYSVTQISYYLQTVLTAFSGAVKAAAELKKSACIIHTGNWGCGGYGNNEEFIYLLQIICAAVSGIKKIIFHYPKKEAFEKAKMEFSKLPHSGKFNDLVKFIYDKNYFWE